MKSAKVIDFPIIPLRTARTQGVELPCDCEMGDEPIDSFSVYVCKAFGEKVRAIARAHDMDPHEAARSVLLYGLAAIEQNCDVDIVTFIDRAMSPSASKT